MLQFIGSLFGKDKITNIKRLSEIEYLEMEILEDAVNIFQIDSDGNELQKIIDFDREVINKNVRDFYDRAF